MTLRGRVVAGPIVNQFRKLEELGQSPMCLLPKRKPCDEFNNAMLEAACRTRSFRLLVRFQLKKRMGLTSRLRKQQKSLSSSTETQILWQI